MKPFLPVLFLLFTLSCTQNKVEQNVSNSPTSDSAMLVKMIDDHIIAMKTKNMDAFQSQFADDAIWINSDGYYFSGKQEIADYHKGLFQMDYHMKYGKVLTRKLDENNALVYFPWRMDWYKSGNPTDTTLKEIGVLTLSASKANGSWKWVSVTVQHTKEFFEDLTTHKAPADYNQ